MANAMANITANIMGGGEHAARVCTPRLLLSFTACANLFFLAAFQGQWADQDDFYQDKNAQLAAPGAACFISQPGLNV